jgi:hypothetical protein
MLARLSQAHALIAPQTMLRLQTRSFAHHSRTVGPNDGLLKEKRELRKFGMKRHFYDKI